MTTPPESLAHVQDLPLDPVRIDMERMVDRAQGTALIDRVFGPGRYAKVSERLREGNRPHDHLSFCAFGGGALVGVVRQWPVLAGAVGGVFLGPIAVDEAWRNRGVGALLMARACAAATDAGEAYILLVGDQALFGPYGFAPAPRGALRMPGPVDPARVLLLPLRPGASEGLAGVVRAPRLPRYG
jgi:predicted N-acetyltransferase YhbS